MARYFSHIDYYGVTFDHLVPADDPDPEVLALSIIEVDNDGGAFANKVLLFPIDPTEYTGKKVLALPRCCQVKKGTQDRGRVNSLVAERDREFRGCYKEGDTICSWLMENKGALLAVSS